MDNYKESEIYQLANLLAVTVHKMSLTLPPFEMQEQGSKIRNTSKSVKDYIVRGFGRKEYIPEFVKHIIFAGAACDETISQLSMIAETHPKTVGLDILFKEYQGLSRKIHAFIEYIREELE